MPQGLRKFLGRLSGLCFGGYLLSWIFDSLVYPALMAAVPDFRLRMLVLRPFAVVLVLILSLGASALVSGLWDLGAGLLKKLRRPPVRTK